MNDNYEVAKIIGAMAFQLICLIAGLTFIGIGTNIDVTIGVFCLIIYHNMTKD